MESNPFGLTYGPVEFPPGWKPAGPPPTPREIKALLEGCIKEMGLRGAEAAAMRQKYRDMTDPYHRAWAPRPTEKIDPALATKLAAQVGDQLGIDVDQLKTRMGIKGD